ncbi:DUF4192 domain-containing protein [Streptomyces sp. NPDC001948]
MTRPSSTPSSLPPIKLSTTADFAELLPYLFDVQPRNSILLSSLRIDTTGHGHVGAALRTDLPTPRENWATYAHDTVNQYVQAHHRRGVRPPTHVVIYLCADPSTNEKAHHTAHRYGMLADHYRAALTNHHINTCHALCISNGRYWSYEGPDAHPPLGTPLPTTPGAVTVAATVAGMTPALRPEALTQALAPLTGPAAETATRALDRAADTLNTRALSPDAAARLRKETQTLINESLARLEATGTLPDAESTARITIGLQDLNTRDWALIRPIKPTTHQLWHHLVRHCTTTHQDLTPPLLTLYGWTSWLAGDTGTARVTLGIALEHDSNYAMAQLLRATLAHGMNPKDVREGIAMNTAP